MGMSNEELIKAQELVYERITGKCRHIWQFTQGRSPIEYSTWRCNKCKKTEIASGLPVPKDVLPPLATSLDAWAEHIWPVMDEEQKRIYTKIITLDVLRDKWLWECTSIHHLEAALRMLGEDELAEKVREYHEKD
jgi:hypothetical protein